MSKYTLEELLAVVKRELATPDGERFTMLRLTQHILEALIDEKQTPNRDSKVKP